MQPSRKTKRIAVLRQLKLFCLRRRRRRQYQEWRHRERQALLVEWRIRSLRCVLPDLWDIHFNAESPKEQSDIFRIAILSQCLATHNDSDRARLCRDNCPVWENLIDNKP